MCLTPIRIKTPKKYLRMNGDIYTTEVPCGHCAECKKLMRSEYFFRSYYEAQSTFDSGGYVYFDTLTYSDEHLPHVSEFIELPSNFTDCSCFRYEDVRLFFVRLRRAMSRRGLKNDGNLKYFLSSEYGTSEKGTHRPHYHVLFFVRNNFIDPLELSRMVNECWQLGRTDGIDYHNYFYVRKHIFGNRYSADLLHMQQVCNYVSKYVTKDSAYEKVIHSRLNRLFKNRYLDTLSDTAKYQYVKGFRKLDIRDVLKSDRSGVERMLYKCVEKRMSQFHRQSHGFGEDFLKYNDYKEVFDTGMISMPSKKGRTHIPLPMYYQRKLFYRLNRDFQNYCAWELNEEGVKFKLSRRLKSVDLMADKFRDWQINMHSHNYYYDGADADRWYNDLITKFDELNNGRDLRDFAEYLLFYKGRVKSIAQLERELNGVYKVDEKVGFFLDGCSKFSLEDKVLYNFNTPSTRKLFGTAFITDKCLGNISSIEHLTDIENKEFLRDNIHRLYEDENVDNDVLNAILYMYVGNLRTNKNGGTRYSILDFKDDLDENGEKMFGHLLSSNEFFNNWVINDTSDEKFVHYDEMYDIWCRAQLPKNEFKQDAFDSKEAITKKHKDIYSNNICKI